MRRLFAILLFVAACGDNATETPKDAAPADAAPDAGPTVLEPCLERPTDVARAPTGALPCELLPPGFTTVP